MARRPPARLTAAVVAAVVGTSGCGGAASPDGPELPPPGAAWDYQLGGGYPPPAGVRVVVRDWSDGEPLASGWSACYVNAFQTQPDDPDASADDRRADETSSWPADLVLHDLGSDPGWPGELLVDLSTEERRREAADWVRPMLETCAAKGFDGVELDNLDSWTRFSGTGVRVPFGQDEAVAYAALLAATAHELGLAVARKNTPGLDRETSLRTVGFDFAIAEECGAFDECAAYVDVFGQHVLAVEYTDEGMRAACEQLGSTASVVRRDVGLTTTPSPTYVHGTC